MVDHSAINLVLTMRPGAQQGTTAQQIDPARYAMSQAVQALQSAALERRRTREASHGQSVRDVLRALGCSQGIQVKTGDHTLGQLFEFRPRQHGAQFGLTNQHDLQQLALGGFEIGEQAQLFQYVGCEVLCLVNDQDTALARGMAGQQEVVEGIDVVLDRWRGLGSWLQLDMEFLAD